MKNIEKWTIVAVVLLSWTGISVANLGKAMVTPFHLLMGAFIGYGILVSRKQQNHTFVSLVFLLAYVLFVNALQFPRIRYTSILYTVIYGVELTILYNLLRRCRADKITLAFKIIIYSYLANIFLGFVLDTLHIHSSALLRFIRIYYTEGSTSDGRPMGFSSEPSYATFIMAVAFMCYSHLRGHVRDKTTLKLFIAVILGVVFSKSAYGFVFVAVLILDWAWIFFQQGDRLLRNVFPFLLLVGLFGGLVFAQVSENESVTRIRKFSTALLDNSVSGQKKMRKLQEADGSAFARIGPTYMLFNTGDDYAINFWLGEGAGAAGEFLALFLVGILVDEGRTSVDAGIIPSFVFDYGIIGSFLFFLFLLNCFYNLSFSFWLLLLLILPNANINTQLIWFTIAAFLFVSIVEKARILPKNEEFQPILERTGST
ncbi:MAG: hypothetical protein AB8G22_17905 [Saprospiraceae bacterium]